MQKLEIPQLIFAQYVETGDGERYKIWYKCL